MISIIIILTASYIGDDVRIVYSLTNTMRSFSVTDGRTDGRTNKAILGVGWHKCLKSQKVAVYIYIIGHHHVKSSFGANKNQATLILHE